MKQIAILGFGIVGGGIPTVLEENAEEIRRTVGDGVEIRYILDLRDFPDSPLGDRVVHSIDPILADPEVSAVCEAMGGLRPAYEFTAACLRAGKSVVTSNKELVSEKGGELLRLARENGCYYFFEGSVGGGIPLIRPFLTSYAGERVCEIAGIVNGTTNYILTAMQGGRSFADTLREAQELGYAEREPSADVDGIDAKRKIMILTGLISGMLPDAEDVYTEGIRDVTESDMEGAKKAGGTLRLIARAVVGQAGTGERGVSAGVCPMIVPDVHPLAGVNGVYNAVSLTLPSTGDILYYGRGAGRLPTAAALVSDLTAVLSGAAGAERMPSFGKVPAGTLIPFASLRRLCADRKAGVRGGGDPHGGGGRSRETSRGPRGIRRPGMRRPRGEEAPARRPHHSYSEVTLCCTEFMPFRETTTSRWCTCAVPPPIPPWPI